MSDTIGWVQQPKYKKGLDPLGVQQPCIAVYSSLLPGLTNVTDRVIYYGFGPWFIWSFAKRYPKATPKEFVETLRRAEVLLALIGARHALVAADDFPDQHDGALVGIRKLRRLVSNEETRRALRLSEYATLNDVPARYFKNRRGGLGQYYLGVLRDEYQLLRDRKDGVMDFTLERGQPLAEAVAKGVDSDRFFRALEADKVSIDELDRLACFCSCQLRTRNRLPECTLLLDTILGLQPDLSKNAESRRRSINLTINFLRAANGREFSFSSDNDFLVACYARVLPNGEAWRLTPEEESTADLWGFYFREELFSLATQRLLREALLAIDARREPLINVEAAGHWCASTKPFVEAARRGNNTYNAVLASVKSVLPPLSDIEDEHHEVQLWGQVIDTSGDASSAVKAALELIVTLLVRKELASYSIERAVGANRIRLEHYPVNIDSVTARSRTRWPSLPVREWIADILSWIMATHRQVALRKLAQSGDDTRRLRMGEDGLYVYGDMIDVAQTMPRLRPLLRFLHDLGLTEATEFGRLRIPTQHALKIFEKFHGS